MTYFENINYEFIPVLSSSLKVFEMNEVFRNPVVFLGDSINESYLEDLEIEYCFILVAPNH